MPFKRYTILNRFSICLLVLIVSCNTAKTSLEKDEALAALETKLNQKDFKLDIYEALPFNTQATSQVLNRMMVNTGNTANRITVNGYDITFKNDSVMGKLPYYGEQRINTGRNTVDLGVSFNDLPKNYKLTKHDNKDVYIMEFSINDINETSESYNVIITFFPNNTANVNIVPLHRNVINYRGRFASIE